MFRKHLMRLKIHSEFYHLCKHKFTGIALFKYQTFLANRVEDFFFLQLENAAFNFVEIYRHGNKKDRKKKGVKVKMV